MKKFLLAATALTALAGPALAADLAVRAPAPYAPAPAAYVPAFTWTGFYVGANAGGAVSSDITSTTVFDPSVGGGVDKASVRAGGFAVGGTLGYNYQIYQNFVIGVEGDIGYADIQAKSTTSGFGFSSTDRIGVDGYLGTIRGRIGYAMGQWLFYGTGGYAFADGRAVSTATSPFGTVSSSASRDLQGYVVGGGVEYAMTPNLSVKGEYLYMDFDKQRVVSPLSVTSVSQDAHLLKIGVNYKFNGLGF